MTLLLSFHVEFAHSSRIGVSSYSVRMTSSEAMVVTLVLSGAALVVAVSVILVLVLSIALVLAISNAVVLVLSSTLVLDSTSGASLVP